jgi:hypothetical protein
MRTTIDIPEQLMKRAKMKAVEEGISLKELFTRSLEKELSEGTPSPEAAPWKKPHGQGTAASLGPEESGFDDYSGPDWHYGTQLNEPDG